MLIFCIFIILVLIFIILYIILKPKSNKEKFTDNNIFNLIEQGGIGDGISDNSSILQKIIDNSQNKSITINIPYGRFLLKSKILCVRGVPFNIVIRGESTFGSIFICEQDGFIFNLTGTQSFVYNGNYVSVQNITFESKSNTSSFTAIRLETINSFAGGMLQGEFKNLSFHQSDGYNGWQYGIRIINCQLIRISEISFTAGGTAICFGRDEGETETDFDHQFVSVNFWISQCYIQSAVYGIKIGLGLYQGFQIWSTYFVGVNFGIKWFYRTYQFGESPSDMLIISGCHIDSNYTGISVDGLASIVISNNYFLSASRSDAKQFISTIAANNCSRISITGNILKSTGEFPQLKDVIGNAIQLINSDLGLIISGNSFNDWSDVAIVTNVKDYDNSFRNNILMLNTFNNIKNPIYFIK